MDFSNPVYEGKFIKRYKRFFADIEIKGKIVTAHCPNTGSMKGCMFPNAPCRVTFTDDPKRKLKYTLQMIKSPSSWIGVNTHLSNQLVWEAWEQKKIPHWKKYKWAQKEVKISDKTRIDFALALFLKEEVAFDKINLDAIKEKKFHFVEVKNVTLSEGNTALFPDAVTTRGQKHLLELIELIEQGHSAELLYTVQRNDCDLFRPADNIDPEYGKLLREAKKAGLKVSIYPTILEKDQVALNTQEPLKLKL